MGIPVGKVYSSKFARAQETAKLGFADAVATSDVTEGGLVVSPNENNRRTAALRKLLEAKDCAVRAMLYQQLGEQKYELLGLDRRDESGDVTNALVEATEKLVLEELKVPKEQMKVEKWG